MRFDAASNAYIFDLPSHPPGAFRTTSSNDTYWSGGLATGSTLWPPISVLKPTATNPLTQLSYTSFASYSHAGPMEDLPHGVVAFGTPTASSAVPITGSATMNAVLAGVASDRLATIGGTASFNFNFGAGTFSGNLAPILYPFYENQSYALGTYTFSNTRLHLGAVFRQLTIAGFAPTARLVIERNRSNVEFYDYKRPRTEFGISRAF